MAATKISALVALAGIAVDDLDEFVVNDKSDTTMAPSGSTKRITAEDARLALRSAGTRVYEWERWAY